MGTLMSTAAYSNVDTMRLTLSCGRKFHSDHLGAALLRRGALEKVITANPPFAYRRHASLVRHVAHTLPFYVPGLLLARLPVLGSLAPQLGWWASRCFDRAVARHLAGSQILLAWAWSARQSFQRARELGITCVLEECGSANLHQEAILSEEHARLGLPYRNPIAARVIANERLECDLADTILCPSEYVANSFAIYGIPRSKCLVIPYATNPRFRATQPKAPDKSLHVLFVGSVGVRKGLLYLLQALALLNDPRITCTVIGRVDPVLAPLLVPYQHLFHHIPSVPHDEMPGHFAAANVFVLPTLDEGMAYVVMEALASGTPVITTPNSGAEGIVRQGQNGFLVPIRESEAIADALSRCLADPELVERLSAEALATATAWSWDDYAQTLLTALAG